MIKIDTSDIRRLERDLQKTANQINRFAVKVLNKAVKRVQSPSISIIKKVYNVPRKLARNDVRMISANLSRPTAILIYAGGSYGLEHFKPKLLTKRRGVSVNIKKRRKKIGTAFMIGSRVYKRKPGAKRAKRVYTIGLATMVQQEGLKDRIRAKAGQSFRRIMDSGIKSMMKRKFG